MPCERGTTLDRYTWGARNHATVAHPFVQLDPRLARWLAAPVRALPGDSFMPRVQHRTSGASERLVVSPGREAQGLFHMPGGQSRATRCRRTSWRDTRRGSKGEATPLLPGEERHRLRLRVAEH